GQDIQTSSATCAMHYMGTAVGLAASIHVLSAIGGSGPVELDANPNPLRTELGDLDLTVRGGHLSVPAGPGLGFVPDPLALRHLSIAEMDLN
ncbi:MAG: mandelate racemase/muconate lactonizing enzyme family protein, partial [Cohaesibacter sp.]|nr:mandelate racemase/muconate lactonizing enzyme family protein [Cohaesibacter sp.]